MKYLLVLFCFFLFFNTTISKNDKYSLKGKSKKFTGIICKSGDVNFGDSFEKCKELFKSEGYTIDSIKFSENKDTIVFVNKGIVYDIGLKNCRFEFDINGLHTLVYRVTKVDFSDSNEIQLMYDKIFYSLKENYNKFETMEELTHSLTDNGCFSNYSKVVSFGNKIREIILKSSPEKSDVNNSVIYSLKFYQHYNFLDKNK